MKFKLFILILFLPLALPAFAQQKLEARIEKGWTVESARQEAFNGAKQWVDLSWASPTDANWRDNFRAICSEGLITYEDRVVTAFRDPVKNRLLAYSVAKYDDNKAFYYDFDGNLVFIDFDIYPQNIKNLREFSQNRGYSVKAYRHSYPDGKLVEIWIAVSKKDSYSFLLDGRLSSHCVGDTCYYASGRTMCTMENRDVLSEKP